MSQLSFIRGGVQHVPLMSWLIPNVSCWPNREGNCAGVDRAVETVERALDKYGAPVYVRRRSCTTGVVETLTEQGAVFVE